MILQNTNNYQFGLKYSKIFKSKSCVSVECQRHAFIVNNNWCFFNSQKAIRSIDLFLNGLEFKSRLNISFYL